MLPYYDRGAGDIQWRNLIPRVPELVFGTTLIICLSPELVPLRRSVLVSHANLYVTALVQLRVWALVGGRRHQSTPM